MKQLHTKVTVGLLLLTVAASAPGQYVSQTLEADAVVTMTEWGTFEPQEVFAPRGGVVLWENHDAYSFHTVKSDTPPYGPESDLVFRNGLPFGTYYWWRVPVWARSGSVFYYHCKFHGLPGSGMSSFGNGILYGVGYNGGFGMVGRVVVL